MHTSVIVFNNWTITLVNNTDRPDNVAIYLATISGVCIVHSCNIGKIFSPTENILKDYCNEVVIFIFPFVKEDDSLFRRLSFTADGRKDRVNTELLAALRELQGAFGALQIWRHRGRFLSKRQSLLSGQGRFPFVITGEGINTKQNNPSIDVLNVMFTVFRIHGTCTDREQ